MDQFISLLKLHERFLSTGMLILTQQTFFFQVRRRIANATWIIRIVRTTAMKYVMPRQAAAIFQLCTAIAMVCAKLSIHRSFVTANCFFCTENLLRGINDLIALIKKLQQDIANQHADIRRLQSLIENCAGCREPQNLRLDTCQYANPCFPGKWHSQEDDSVNLICIRLNRQPIDDQFLFLFPSPLLWKLRCDMSWYVKRNEMRTLPKRIHRRWQELPTRADMRRPTMLSVSSRNSSSAHKLVDIYCTINVLHVKKSREFTSFELNMKSPLSHRLLTHSPCFLFFLRVLGRPKQSSNTAEDNGSLFSFSFLLSPRSLGWCDTTKATFMSASFCFSFLFSLSQQATTARAYLCSPPTAWYQICVVFWFLFGGFPRN